MVKILFDENASLTNNNFHKGINVTVRRGTKYMERLKPTDTILLENLKGEYLGEGVVIQLIIGHITDIPECVLVKEHDPKCRNIDGLLEVLKSCYNDSEITKNEIVTAIVFRLTCSSGVGIVDSFVEK